MTDELYPVTAAARADTGLDTAAAALRSAAHDDPDAFWRGQVAIVREADDPATPPRDLTYGELLAETCRMANVLAGLGVKRGDRVTIYLPMIPEAAVAMLACARRRREYLISGRSRLPAFRRRSDPQRPCALSMGWTPLAVTVA